MKKLLVALFAAAPTAALAHPGHESEPFAHMPVEWVVALAGATVLGAAVYGYRAWRNR